MQNRRRDSPRRSLLRVPALCAAALICLWAVWSMWAVLADAAQSEAVLSTLRSYVTYRAADEEEENGSQAAGVSAAAAAESRIISAEAGADPSREEAVQTVLSVDFAGLHEVNPDICGWIRIPGTDVSHPVVQGSDNAYYLTHGPDRETNRAGSIFLDAACPGNFMGVNSIVYGHRMNNGTMFGGLHAFQDPEFLAAHPCIFVSTPEGETAYQIFEVSEADAALSGPAYQTEFAGESAVRSWGSTPVGNTCYAFQDPQITPSDRVLTLSTCVRGNSNRRLILRAKAMQG